MTKKLSSVLAVIFCCTLAFSALSEVVSAEETSDYNEAQTVSDLEFEAELLDTGVQLKWNEYTTDGFNYYKIIRSETNPNPVYPEDGYIYYSADKTAESFLDKTILADKSYYYRVCSIASPDRFCSEVIKIEVPSDYLITQGNIKEATNKEKVILKSLKESITKRILKFKDIKDSDWVFPFAQKLGDLGIVNTDRDNLFPYNQISRAESVTLLVRAYEKLNGTIEINTDYNFLDVNESFWAYETLRKALSVGIIAENTMFSPSQDITRAQFSKIIATSFFKDSISEVTEDVFNDVPVSYWASKYIQVLKSNNLVTGSDDDNFRPDKPLSRAEGLKIISKAIEVIDPSLTTSGDEEI